MSLRRVVEALLAAALLLSCAPATPPATAQGVPAPSTQGIAVEGPHLLRNGVPWVPRAIQIVGLVAPQGALGGKYIAANEHFGEAELRAAVAAHADAVRFQVSEFGVDPEGQLYSPRYVQQVHDAVDLARRLGLAVIVSLQAEPPAGEPTRCALPDAGAERAWEQLAPMFAGDDGVMFELYNEPAIAATASGWAMWQSGGIVTNSKGTCQAVGMQTLVNDIRAAGATNVIVVPGLSGEQTLAGMPPLTDPADSADPQLAYGVHYPSLAKGPAAWDRAFGVASGSLPVIVTEWDANSVQNCVPDTPSRAQLLLDYLAGKQIGIVGFAFDLPGTIVADWSYQPTSYKGFACGTPGDGPGQLLLDGFAAMARAGDGPPRGPAPAWLVSGGSLEDLTAIAPALTAHYFDTPRAFATGAGTPALEQLSAPTAVATASFTDERTLAAAILHHRLRPGTRAVLYDDEPGSQTPRAQQLRPGEYYSRAAQVAHSHNLLLIAAPSPAIVLARAPKTPARRIETLFLQSEIAVAAARHADVFAIQAQDDEMHPTRYASFVQAVAFQAATAHPGIELLATLSTNPEGRRQTGATLFAAAARTWSIAPGYWLQDPGRGRACPNCRGPYPGVAVTFLRKLRSDAIGSAR